MKKLIEKKPNINKKIKKNVPIFNLKRIFRLCKTLCHQFPRLTFQNSIKTNLFLHETKLKAKKLGHLDEKTAKNGYLYICAIQSKTTFQSQKVIH